MSWDHIGFLLVIGLVSFILSYLGAAVGLILGHMRLPLLVYALGNPISGASTNLAISGIGAMAGTYRHWRDGRIGGEVLLLMGVPSVIGAILAILVVVSVSLFWSHLVIGLMLVCSGFALLRNEDKSEPSQPQLGRRWRIFAEAGCGLFFGALAAVTGLMLGSMRLPVMLKLFQIDPKVAVGTNMAIGCLTAVVAAVTAALAGGQLDWLALLIVGPPTIAGSVLGAQLTGKISKEQLRSWVGYVVGFTGVFMTFQAAQSLLPRPPVSSEPSKPVPDIFLQEDLPTLFDPDWEEPQETDLQTIQWGLTNPRPVGGTVELPEADLLLPSLPEKPYVEEP